jgi:predicted nuclease of predicted toxin-antitoxin system
MIAVLCDEHIPHSVVTALRLRGEQIFHCEDIGHKGFSDTQHFAFAAENNYAFFTYDIADFTTLHTAYINAGKHHAGLLLSAQLPPREVIRRLSVFLQTRNEHEIRDNLWYI